MQTYKWWLATFLSAILFIPGTSKAAHEFSMPGAVSYVADERAALEATQRNALFSNYNSIIRNALPTVEALPNAEKVAEKRNSREEPPIIGIPVAIPALEKVTAVQNSFKQFNATTNGVLLGLRIHSPTAVGMRIGILVESIPDAVTLAFFTAIGETPIVAPVTSEQIKNLIALNQKAGDLSAAGRTYWSPLIEGAEAIVLVHVPANVNIDSVRFSIPQISFIFQSPLTTKAAGSCNLDATCYANWNSQAQSVAKMVFSSDGGTYMCTGSLLNDSDTATTIPYFLSANHCISTQTAASSLETLWFLQSASCNSSTVLDSRYTTRTGGATLLYASAVSDTSFMRLNAQPPTGLLYIGWTTTDLASNGAVTGIHHPSGDWKKISFGNLVGYMDCASDGGGYSCSPATSTTGEFLDIRWNSGITEGGSSGSILLNSNGQAVGQLYGGGSYCYAPTEPDQYGRFSIAYTNALKQWLGNGVVTAPTAPSNLRATVASASRINLTWTDTSNNETGFKIERKTGATGTWGQIATVGANVVSYANTGLAAATLYYYRIRSYNGTLNSAYTAVVSATTQVAGTPNAPSVLKAVVSSSTQINLTWTDNSTNETGFKIERKTGAAGTWGQIAMVGANVLSYSNTGLTAATLYYYRVRSYNGTLNSGYSNEVNATTTGGCSSTITVPGTANGTLTTTDCVYLGSYYYDKYNFTATAGSTYTITLNSTVFDAYLDLYNGTTRLAWDDDGNGGTNAKLVYPATTSGTLSIYASSFDSLEVGAYTIAISKN